MIKGLTDFKNIKKRKGMKYLLLTVLFLTMGTGAVMASQLNDRDDLGVSVAALSNPGWPKVYIISYNSGIPVDETTDTLKASYGLEEVYRYKTAIQGAAFLIPDVKTLHSLIKDSHVKNAVPDREVKLIPEIGYKVSAKSTSRLSVQTIPTGLIRIAGLQTNNEGNGVVVAVIDTGIDLDHPDLAANIHPVLNKDCVGDSITLLNPGNDGDGHGSHVAGTIAAINNSIGSLGVGSNIKLVPVRVLNRRGSGTLSSVICGIEYVTDHSDVINISSMSLGGSGADYPIDPMHTAIIASVNSGVTYTVAAGNNGIDAANFVPAAYDEVITVSAYDASSGDIGFPWWSNYGSDVDIAAPGVSIYSTYKNGGYTVLSGTSMATPHVAAAAALYLRNNPGASPAAVRTALINAGETGYNGQGGLHPERLLNVSQFH